MTDARAKTARAIFAPRFFVPIRATIFIEFRTVFLNFPQDKNSREAIAEDIRQAYKLSNFLYANLNLSVRRVACVY